MKNLSLAMPALCICMILACNTAPEKKEEPVKITTIGENAATLQAMMALSPLYKTKEPGVQLDFKPNTFEDAFAKSNQDLANGTALYDIILQYNFALSPFVRNHYIYPLDELLADVPDSLKNFEKDIFPKVWRESGYYYKDPQHPSSETVKVGYPMAANTMLLMYNRTMFEDPEQRKTYQARYHQDLKVPANWEDFLRVASFFTQPDKKIYGVCLEGASGGWLYYEFVNFLFGMGGKLMDKDYGWQGDEHTKVLLNSSETLNALRLYKNLKPFNAGNFTNVEQSEQMKILKAGKVAMGIVWSDVLYSAVSSMPGFGDHFAFAPIPGNTSILSGCACFVNRKSRHPQIAFRYILDLMQPEMQVQLARKGLCSPLRTTYDNPDVQKLLYTRALKASLDRGAYTLEAGPDADMISEKVTTWIQKMWTGGLTPEQTSAKLQEEVVTARNRIFTQLK